MIIISQICKFTMLFNILTKEEWPLSPFSFCLQDLSILHFSADNDFAFFFVVVQSLSCVRLFVTQWTVACQGPMSMEFSKQKY